MATTTLDRSVLPPTLSEQQLKSLYPDQLKLLHVSIFHRHGERTPVKAFIPSFVPDSTWTLCSIQSSFNAAFESFQQEVDKHSVVGNHKNVHLPYHPAHESANTRSSESSLSTVVESPSKFISVDNLNSVGPVQRRIEESDVTGAQIRPPVPSQCFYGQLTDKGRESLFQLGKGFRDLYVEKLGFLPATFNLKTHPGYFYFRTTDYPRTMESLQHLLAGIYPVSKREGTSLPVIHTRFSHEETLIASGSCKKYRQLIKDFKEQYKTDSAQKIDGMKEKMKHILVDPALPNLHSLYDTFVAQHAHSLPLPPGVTEKDIIDLENHAQMLWFEVYRINPLAPRLAVGRFLKEYRQNIISQVLEKTGDFKDLKFAVFSAHDSTIAPLLGAFNASDGQWPPFSANIVIEYFKDQKDADNYVRLKYNSQVVEIPECQQPGKGHSKFKGFCTAKAFLEIVDRHIPINYEEECKE